MIVNIPTLHLNLTHEELQHIKQHSKDPYERIQAMVCAHFKGTHPNIYHNRLLMILLFRHLL